MSDLTTAQIIQGLKAHAELQEVYLRSNLTGPYNRDNTYVVRAAIARLEEHVRTIERLRDDRSKLKAGITRELQTAIERLGPDSDRGSLLAIVSSYGDTLDDADMLLALKDYNSAGKPSGAET